MSQLRTAVDALVTVAEQAGIPAEAAREEAMSFAAAIAEAAPRAAADWAAAQADSGGLAGSEAHQIHTAFFDGRRGGGTTAGRLADRRRTARRTLASPVARDSRYAARLAHADTVAAARRRIAPD